MANPLPSKPGLTGATALSIPKTWDPAWFRGFINNMLKGADVRNAIGTNGIKVSGTIASPYATISISGSGGPITGPLTISASGNGTVNAPLTLVGTTDGPFNLVLSDGTNTQSYLGFGAAANGHHFQIGTVGAFAMEFVTNNIIRAAISSAGLITGWGTTAAGLVDMQPDSGSFTFTLTGCTTSPTGTAVWAKMGNLVALVIPALNATSNTTSMTMTGLPAEIQAARAQNCIINFLSNNTTTGYGSVQVTNTGTIIFFVTSNVSNNGFTAAGTKGMTAVATIVYALN